VTGAIADRAIAIGSPMFPINQALTTRGSISGVIQLKVRLPQNPGEWVSFGLASAPYEVVVWTK